ncbi:MAG: endonuclease/exonuclease/phosphatase family protein [Bacteroidota bacterium]
MKVVLLILAVFWVVATVLPLIRAPYWWVRMFDFPRAQITVGALVTLGLFGVANLGFAEATRWEWVTFVALGLSVAYQCARMLPYVPVWPTQVAEASPEADPERQIRLVISNVLMENRERERWLRVIRDADPDVLAAVETDAWWTETAEALADRLPHAIEVPQDDTYGMLVRSRFPILRHEVRHFVESTVPSIDVAVELASGEAVRLLILHPRPPRPDIQQDSRLRDAELVLAGEETAGWDEPTIVAGDLNDVAWSHSTTLFQQLSGLLDPRIGRGLFATFHADHWWLRYPLDHVFHSDDLALVHIERLSAVGSDHFPMRIDLAIDPSKRSVQEAPDLDRDDREDAQEAVDDAVDQLQSETPAEREERHRQDQ